MKFKSTSIVFAITFAASAAFAADPAHWEYTGHAGARHWGELEEGFVACKLGKEQSPIDIHGAKKAKLAPIAFNYTASPAEIVNNGHTVQINLASAGAIAVSSGEYKLVQFHFHTPSEEKINGKNYPLVAHLVHKSADGKLAVVAVLFKTGGENAALKKVFENLPAKAGETKALEGQIDIASLLPTDRGYYAYMGSLTTPPCSEGVHWHVMKNPVTLSTQQLAAFKKLYAMNARPVQPLNGRKLEVSQ